jgi:hypothetical protein
MINGKASDFIECLSYEDNYAIFRGNKYFFNGCQSQKNHLGEVVLVKLEVYDLTNKSTIYSVSQKTVSECLSALQEAKIWDGKSFWDVEQEFEWVDD